VAPARASVPRAAGLALLATLAGAVSAWAQALPPAGMAAELRELHQVQRLPS
jgi:hypothetical protein